MPETVTTCALVGVFRLVTKVSSCVRNGLSSVLMLLRYSALLCVLLIVGRLLLIGLNSCVDRILLAQVV